MAAVLQMIDGVHERANTDYGHTFPIGGFTENPLP